MTGRNQTCPCGSGKKYKHCHGKNRPSGVPPQQAQQRLEQAQQLVRLGQYDQALLALDALPAHPAKYQLQARLYMTAEPVRDLARAERVLKAWRRLQPANPEPLYRFLDMYLNQRAIPEAGRMLIAVQKLAPTEAYTHYYQGLLAQLGGQAEASLQHYQRAVEKSLQIKVTRHDLQLEAAIEMFEAAAGQYPGSPDNNSDQLIDKPVENQLMGEALRDWAAAGVLPRRLHREQQVRYGNAAYNLGCCALSDFERIDEALEYFKLAREINPEHELALLNGLFALNYSNREARFVAAEHRRIGQQIRQQVGPVQTAFDNTADPKRKIRLGYLSSDLRNHSVARFILPVLTEHDAEQFAVYAYSTAAREDRVSQQIRQQVDQYRLVAGLSDQQLQQQIIQDRIDILVDLNGLTKGHRVAVLARRAAPVQMTWIGYPNTTGLDSVDYRLVDEITDPPGSEALSTETLLHMPQVFSVYQPTTQLPEAGSAPVARNGYITFGSFNHLPKINRTLIACWADILRQVPAARLIIKNTLLGYAEPQRRLREAFVTHGVDDNRLQLLGRTANDRDHLRHYQQVDICLDTFPYNGTTTTCDALAMGVPVVALAGSSHVSRVSASQLAAIGLSRLVAKDRDSYISLAVQLATQTELLEMARHKLRERFFASPLTDARQFTDDYEQQLRRIWVKWCAQTRTE